MLLLYIGKTDPKETVEHIARVQSEFPLSIEHLHSECLLKVWKYLKEKEPIDRSALGELLRTEIQRVLSRAQP